MNNHVYYYHTTVRPDPLVNEQQYIGSVKTIQLNSTMAAVLCDGRVCLHKIVPDKESELRTYPEKVSSTSAFSYVVLFVSGVFSSGFWLCCLPSSLNACM